VSTTDKFLLFLAQGCYSGRITPAPGTWGSFAALILAWFIQPNIISIVLAFFLGIFLCDKAEVILNESDPHSVVFDEWVGIWISVWLIPHHIGWYLLAFALFRLFDISKFWLVDKMQQYDGGLGVMLDDVMAGIFSAIILFVLMLIF